MVLRNMDKSGDSPVQTKPSAKASHKQPVMPAMSWKSVVERQLISPPAGAVEKLRHTGGLESKPQPLTAPTSTPNVRGKVTRSRSISRIIDTPGFRKKTYATQIQPCTATVVDGMNMSKNKSRLFWFHGVERNRRSVDGCDMESVVVRLPRERSASADEALLRHPVVPLWISEPSMHRSIVNGDVDDMECGKSDPDAYRRRKERAMSVPGCQSLGESESQGDLSDTFSDENETVGPFDIDMEKMAIGRSSGRQSADLCGAATPSKTIRKRSKPIALVNADYYEFDSDETQSESTSNSSCTSPRHSPVTHRVDAQIDESVCDDSTRFPLDEEQDHEAFMLLDRINQLSAEFKAHRDFEESNSLAWLVQHAARQRVIPAELQHSLMANT